MSITEGLDWSTWAWNFISCVQAFVKRNFVKVQRFIIQTGLGVLSNWDRIRVNSC